MQIYNLFTTFFNYFCFKLMAYTALNLAHRPLCSCASLRVTRAAASVALPSLPRPRLSGAAVPCRSSWRVLPWCLATLALAKSKDAKACEAEEGNHKLRSVKLHSIEEGDSEPTQIVVLVHGLDSWSGRKLSFLGSEAVLSGEAILGFSYPEAHGIP